jgi:hypothetical protein
LVVYNIVYDARNHEHKMTKWINIITHKQQPEAGILVIIIGTCCIYIKITYICSFFLYTVFVREPLSAWNRISVKTALPQNLATFRVGKITRRTSFKMVRLARVFCLYNEDRPKSACVEPDPQFLSSSSHSSPSPHTSRLFSWRRKQSRVCKRCVLVRRWIRPQKGDVSECVLRSYAG